MKYKLGKVFGDSIVAAKKRQFREIGKTDENFRQRLTLFKVIFIVTFLIIIIQLIKLTVFQGNYYSLLSQGNRIKENIYPAPRGVILDRKGETLVQNKPGFIAEVACGEKKCFRKISHDEALKLEAAGQVSAQSLGVVREYIDSIAFSHVIGLAGSVAEEEIGKLHCGKKLNFGDELGRSGVEQAFDCQLQGISGKELIEVDAKGNLVRILSKVNPSPGKSLTLSIDKRLQLKAKEAMEGKIGAVIVHIPQTGELLVLYSSPSYDLNPFVEGLGQKDYENLLNDPQKPLFNRAISGTYPPGSVIKPIWAAGALEEKVINKDTQIEDTGIISIGPFSFPNWYFTQYGGKEGLINVISAIKRSNDIFFYKAGEMLGVERIAEWAKKFNFGQRLGIEIVGEEEGLVPDEVWKEKVKGEKWFLGDTYHLAIGQGDLLVTPLQIAFANGAIGNNGIICKPTLLKTGSCQRLTEKLVSVQNLKTIREGMTQACQQGGTAYPFFGFKVGDREIKVACKTGTAEYDPPAGGPKKTHAWFTAFAPAENPQIAVTVLVEGGGEGSAVAAPIAKSIMDEWFKM